MSETDLQPHRSDGGVGSPSVSIHANTNQSDPSQDVDEITPEEERCTCVTIWSTLDDAGLDPYARTLFGHIRRREGSDGTGCWESVPNMAEICEMSPARLRDARNELERRRFIRVHRRQGGTHLITTRPKSDWLAKNGTPLVSEGGGPSDSGEVDPSNTQEVAPSDPRDKGNTEKGSTTSEGDAEKWEIARARAPTREAFKDVYASSSEHFQTGEPPISLDELKEYPAVQMLFDEQWCGYFNREIELTEQYQYPLQKVSCTVTDFHAWYSALEHWAGNSFNPSAIEAMLDRYEKHRTHDLPRKRSSGRPLSARETQSRRRQDPRFEVGR